MSGHHQQKIARAKLNTFLTIEQPIRVSDQAGGYSTSWQVLAAVWGWVRHVGSISSDSYGNNASVGGQRFRLVIRYRSDVTADMRILIDGKIYRILSVVDPDHGQHTLELIIEKGEQ